MVVPIVDGRTFLPLRFCGTHMGAEVEFDPSTMLASLIFPYSSFGGEDPYPGIKRPSKVRNIKAVYEYKEEIITGPHTITVTWDEPSDDGGMPIIGYTVSYKYDNQQVIDRPSSDRVFYLVIVCKESAVLRLLPKILLERRVFG